ncbi:MAG: hypothetical protein KA998_04035 [Rickettsiaceae bacterium]|nr:hypothetical protein [Rickettsiaceae bacterium]
MRNVKTSNYQDLIKTFAIIVVIIDHLGVYFFPSFTIFRAIGRSAMPVFCFFVGYNYTKPKTALVIYGAILTSMFFVCFVNIHVMNMLITMYICQWYLYVLDKYGYNDERSIWIQIPLLLLLLRPSEQFFEYGTLATIFVLVGNFSRRNGANFSMIMLSLFVYLANNIYLFKFGILDSIVASIFIIFVLYMLSRDRQLDPIRWNLRWISRNTLYIYFFDVFLSIIALLVMYSMR